MSTTRPPVQAALDAFDEGRILPQPGQPDLLSCELCGETATIVFSSDVATLCADCSSRLSRLPPASIPGTLAALRAARKIHASRKARHGTTTPADSTSRRRART